MGTKTQLKKLDFQQKDLKQDFAKIALREDAKNDRFSHFHIKTLKILKIILSSIRNIESSQMVLCFPESWELNRNPGALFDILPAIAERPDNFKVASYKL